MIFKALRQAQSSSRVCPGWYSTVRIVVLPGLGIVLHKLCFAPSADELCKRGNERSKQVVQRGWGSKVGVSAQMKWPIEAFSGHDWARERLGPIYQGILLLHERTVYCYCTYCQPRNLELSMIGRTLNIGSSRLCCGALSRPTHFAR